MKEVRSEDKLKDLVTVHPESLNEEEIRKFIASEHENLTEIEESRVPFKIWLIPGHKEQEPLVEGERILYMVIKHYHFLADGLSIL